MTMQSDTPDDDNELWNEMMVDVTPLSNKPSQTIRKIIRKYHSSKASHTITTKLQSKENTTAKNQTKPYAKDLDRRTQKKLQRGKMPIEGRLDLHGMTQQQAHSQLSPFITRAYDNNKRCVIVITGKGQGILQSKVPHWLELEPINNMVLKAVHAQPKDGGSGALYVYLRRQR